MVSPEAPRIGFVGFGEVGSNVSRGLKAAGVPAIVAFDKFHDGPFGPLMAKRAQEAGVVLVPERTQLQGCDIVICCVTVADALDAAREMAPALSPGTLYVDVNSTSPRAKKEAAAIVEAKGLRFVDGTIMAAPATEGHRVPILASGVAAPEFRDRLSPFGTNIRVVGDQPGMAASIKIIRSVLTKGLEALYVEALLGARRYGIEDQVLASIGELLDGPPTAEMARRLLTSHVIHAQRRGLEVEASAQTLADVGVEPVMSRATISVMKRTAGLGLKEKFGGQQPATLAEALGAIDSSLAGS